MKKTILVIEDDGPSRDNISEILELADYDVLRAENGKKGLEMVRTNHPDLILCDISMPILDGFGVLHAIQNTPELESIPFVFLTGQAKKGSFRIAMDNGADDYLTKPFSGDELLKVVHAHLKKIQILKDAFSIENGKFTLSNGENKKPSKDKLILDKKYIRKYSTKEFIFHEGDKPEHLYYIVKGKVKAFKMNYWGKEYITDLYKEGDFFGYLALLEGFDHKESVMAIENSQISIISKQEYFDLLNNDTEVSVSFIKTLTANLNIANDKLLSMAYDSARKKVAEALLFINKKYQITGSNDVAFPIRREIISSIAGLSPESVSRNLTDFFQEGLIKINNRTIKIVDLKKLENLKW